MLDQIYLKRLAHNVLALGVRRIAALALAGAAIVGTILFGSHYLTEPDFEVLYSGLSQQDVSRIGGALSEAGIAFDVSADGSKVLVTPEATARARMLLAEKGLPTSATAGYELFDKIGSMGLTSFMQEVTRVRALEGELSRSIQTLRGVRAARVHIVVGSSESFRRERQQPSASVIVRLEDAGEVSSAKAIRHLVAAAVPGMKSEDVQVVSTDGTVLTSDDGSVSEVPNRMIEIERTVSKELQDRIRKTLLPYLGSENVEISVTSRINMDKKQTNETAYDPKSRVERSLRVIRQADNSENSNSRETVGVEQNIPGEENGPAAGDQSKRSNERREEITNFEINTKSTSTESLGYRIEQLNVAVLVNRKRLVEAAGGTVVSGTLDGRLGEVESLVRSAAGIDAARGDKVTVTAVDFVHSPDDLEPVSGRGVGEILLSQVGSGIRALAFVAVALLLIMLGLRPMTRVLLAEGAGKASVEGGALAGERPALPAVEGAGPAPSRTAANELPAPEDDSDRKLAEDIARAAGRSARKRLERIVNLNEEHAAAVLKQWLQQARAG